MSSSKLFAAVLLSSVVPTLAVAQPTSTVPGDVTFNVPLDLSRLDPSITRVAVTCKLGLEGENLSSPSSLDVLMGRVEIPVADGRVVGTVGVVIDVPPEPRFKPGQAMRYECSLTALSSASGTGGGWQSFDAKNGPIFTVTPQPVTLRDTFNW